MRIKPDYHLAWSNWGSAILHWAPLASETERPALCRRALELCQHAYEISSASGAYNAACACASLDDKDRCRLWLDRAKAAGVLPDPGHLIMDPDFEGVRDEQWFHVFLGKEGDGLTKA